MHQAARRRLPGPSLSTSWGLMAWLLVPVAAIMAVGPVREPDVYWHIRMGQDILATGRLGGDPSWTYGPAESSWRTTQAGAELLLHLAYAWASWPGIMLLRVLLAAAVVASLVLALAAVMGRRGRLPVDRAVAIVALLTAAMAPSLVQERPQSLSLLLLPWIGVLVLRVLYADRWPRWWVIGPVVMVWSWFHGSAVVVAPVLALAAIIHAVGMGGRSWIRFAGTTLGRGWAVLVAVLVAPVVGPLGLDYYAQALKIQVAASGRIVEWQPPAANSVVVWLVLALIALWGIAVVHLAARSGAIWRSMRADALLIAVLLVLMTSANRYVAVGVLVVGPLVARRVAQAWTGPPRRLEEVHPGFSAVILALTSIAAVLVAVMASVNVRPVGTEYPWRIWQGLAAQAGERRAFVDYTLGGQAGLLGEATVSIDGRADRYGGAVIDANRAFVAGRDGWEVTLADYPGTTDVVIPDYAGMGQRLEDAGWSVACTDAGYTWLTAPGRTGGCPEE